MGEKVFYCEDGILHIKQIREQRGDEIHAIIPGLESKYVVQRKSLIEITALIKKR